MNGAERKPVERGVGPGTGLHARVQTILEGQDKDIRELGAELARAFGPRGKTQVSNLEQAALHAETFTEVEAWVKRQIGLAGEQSDRRRWQTVGDRVLQWLRKLRNEALAATGVADETRSMEILLAARVPSALLGTACRWLHSEYLYRIQAGAPDGGGRR